MLAHHYLSALDLTAAAGGDTTAIETSARQALREAGRRAYALSALESAVSLYSRARELWPEDDPDYPRLLFELGETLAWARNGGAPELEEAARLLLDAGYVEDAAVAEALAGNAHWVSGRQEVASVHYDRALELIAGLPETRATAQIRALTWRAQLLANENPSLAEGLRILALTEEVGTTESILNARITVGIGHAHFGDPQASIVALELALEQCLLANSHLAARAILNLASVLGTVGELERSAQAASRGGRAGAPLRKPPRVVARRGVRGRRLPLRRMECCDRGRVLVPRRCRRLPVHGGRRAVRARGHVLCPRGPCWSRRARPDHACPRPRDRRSAGAVGYARRLCRSRDRCRRDGNGAGSRRRARSRLLGRRLVPARAQPGRMLPGRRGARPCWRARYPPRQGRLRQPVGRGMPAHRGGPPGRGRRAPGRAQGSHVRRDGAAAGGRARRARDARVAAPRSRSTRASERLPTSHAARHCCGASAETELVAETR